MVDDETGGGNRAYEMVELSLDRLDVGKDVGVIELHRRATAGMLYFLQNDPGLPPAVREPWKTLGFARDEFQDSGHLPAEVYARETRRIKGRAIFTEHDVRLKSGRERSPIHADSIEHTVKFKQGASLKPLAGRKVASDDPFPHPVGGDPGTVAARISGHDGILVETFPGWHALPILHALR